MEPSLIPEANLFGFSTGALERGNYRCAMDWLNETSTETVEISALRLSELKPLIDNLDELHTERFKMISFHAPSSFDSDQEEEVVDLLKPVYRRGWNIVVHPDVICRPSLWQPFGSQLLIENMDRRKAIGRNVPELDAIFAQLPEARLCLDVAHARQLDTTLTLLFQLIHHFAARIAEIHISELDSHCRHVPMSLWAVRDYQSLPWDQIGHVPVIIESMLDQSSPERRTNELELAKKSLESSARQICPAAASA